MTMPSAEVQCRMAVELAGHVASGTDEVTLYESQDASLHDVVVSASLQGWTFVTRGHDNDDGRPAVVLELDDDSPMRNVH